MVRNSGAKGIDNFGRRQEDGWQKDMIGNKRIENHFDGPFELRLAFLCLLCSLVHTMVEGLQCLALFHRSSKIIKWVKGLRESHSQ